MNIALHQNAEEKNGHALLAALLAYLKQAGNVLLILSSPRRQKPPFCKILAGGLSAHRPSVIIRLQEADDAGLEPTDGPIRRRVYEVDRYQTVVRRCHEHPRPVEERVGRLEHGLRSDFLRLWRNRSLLLKLPSKYRN